MEPILSIQQLRVLAEGINNNGRVLSEAVERIYSSHDAAKSSLMTLESWGFVVRNPETCGVFLVIKAPEEAFEIAVMMKEAGEKAKEILGKANTEDTEVENEVKD